MRDSFVKAPELRPKRIARAVAVEVGPRRECYKIVVKMLLVFTSSLMIILSS